MSLLDLPLGETLERFASPDPTPGGGSAAALSGAVAAGLVTMVCTMNRTRTGDTAERSRLAEAGGAARSAGERLRALIDEDSAAYDGVVAAHRLPKATDSEKAARQATIGAAMRRATEVPLETARACLSVMKSAGVALADGNPNAVSDAQTGRALAWAGLQGAAYNVEVNAPSLGDSGAAELGALKELLVAGRALLAEG